MSNVHDVLITTAMQDHLLRIKKVKLPDSDHYERTTVFSPSSSRFVGKGSVQAEVSSFMPDYLRVILGRIGKERAVGPDVEVSYIATGEMKYQEGWGAVRAFTKHFYDHYIMEKIRRQNNSANGDFDMEAAEKAEEVFKTNYPLLKPFLWESYRPTNHDLLMAGLSMLEIDPPSERAEVFQASVETRLLRLWNNLAAPVQIDMRQSEFHVSEVSQDSIPGLYIGRRPDLSDEERHAIVVGDRSVYAGLNFFVAERGRTYPIPPKPFALSPGIKGFHIQFSLSHVEERDDLVRVVAMHQDNIVGVSKITRTVERRTPNDDGFVSLCSDGEGRSLVGVIECDGEDAERQQLDFDGVVGYILPTNDKIQITAETELHTGEVNRVSQSAVPGGGIAVFSSFNPQEITTRFYVKGAAGSSALFIRPMMALK